MIANVIKKQLKPELLFNSKAGRSKQIALALILVVAGWPAVLRAQVPDFTYSGSQTYTTGTGAITPLTPANTGGAVAAPGYATRTQMSTGGNNADQVGVDSRGDVFFVSITTLTAPEGFTSFNYFLNAITSAHAGEITLDNFGMLGLTVDTSGNCFFADNIGINEWQPATAKTSQIFLGYGDNTGFQMDPEGNYYILEGSLIKRIPPGTRAAVIVASVDPLCNFAVDAAGNIYETTTVNGLACIKKHSVNGDPVTLIAQGRSLPFGPIRIDGAGNLYTSTGGTIVIIPLGGGAERDFDTGFDHIPGIMADEQGDIIFSGATTPNYGSDAQVYKMKATGGYFISPVLPVGLYLNSVTGIISGTPIAQSAQTTYTVTAYNASGSNSTTLSLGVNLASTPVISYAAPQPFLKGSFIGTLTPYNTGSPVGAPGYSNTPATIGSGFVSPVSLATDVAGNLYIGDAGQHNVQKVSPGGTPVTIAAGIINPISVAVDATGNVYVADPAGNSVEKIPVGGGAPVSFGTGFSAPNGVTVDAAGNVYVADSGNGVVKEVQAATGNIITLGSGFIRPTGIAVDVAGNVFVTDAGSSLVKEIPAGNGTPTTIGTGFNQPAGIAVDAAGNVFVADKGNDAVKEIMAADGSTVTIGPGFGSPVGVAVYGPGLVYVTDTGNALVKQLTPTGGYYLNPFLPVGFSFETATGIISGTPGAGIAATNYTVTAYNSGGSAATSLTITVNAPPLITYTGAHNYPINNAIAPLSPSLTGSGTASTVDAVGYSNTIDDYRTGSFFPYAIAIDASNNIYWADHENNMVELGGSINAKFPIGVPFGSLMGVAVDAAGNLYVADSLATVITKAVPFGPTSTIGSGLDHPIAVAVDRAGNVYVLEGVTGKVKKIAVNGGGITVIGSGFVTPYSIASDAAGNIYVADSGNNAIKKIPADGSAVVTIASGLNFPQGVTIDHAGNIFFYEQVTDLIKEIPADGSSTITLGGGLQIDNRPVGLAVDTHGNLFIPAYAFTGNFPVKEIKRTGGYYISPELPAGLKFNVGTGIISGTPTAITQAANYTVSAYNGFGGATGTLNLSVFLPVPVISYGGAKVYSKGIAISLLAPASSGGAVAAPAYSSNATAAGVNANPALGFVNPKAVAADADGNVYVGDVGSQSIRELLKSGGNVVTKLAGTSLPRGIAIDALKNIYVADANTTSIIKITTGGATSNIGPALTTPFDVAADAAGNVYVADAANSQIIEILAGSGATVLLGSGLSHPTSVAVDAAGNVYVTDSSNNLVKKIPAGNGAPVAIGTGFNDPSGLAVDASGNVFVADNDNNAVKEILASNGATITIGSGFSHPTSVAVDGAGIIYVADADNLQVKQILPLGGYCAGPFLPAGLTLDNTTGIVSGTPSLITAVANYSITAYNASGASRPAFDITVNDIAPVISYSGPKTYRIGESIAPVAPASSGGTVAAPAFGSPQVVAGVDPLNPALSLLAPVSVVADADGNVYIGDAGSQSIRLESKSGGNPITYVTGFNQPAGLALDASNNLYIANTTIPFIFKIGPGGGLIGTGLIAPIGVAVDAAGNVYVADAGSGQIQEIIVATGATAPLGSGFSHPNSVAVDGLGNLYITDSGTNLVTKIPAGNGTPVVIGTGFTTPTGVAVDASGNVYVADNGNNAVKEILASSGATVTIGSGFNHPNSVTVDGAGIVYVNDSGNNQVTRLNPIGGYCAGPFLPAGLVLNNNTGIISGTPLQFAASKNYIVTAYNSGGSSQAGINITINYPPPAISYSSPKTYTAGTAVTALAPTNSGGPVAAPAYSSSPDVIGIDPLNPSLGLLASISVAADADGNVFVGDAGNQSIRELQKSGGDPVTLFTGFSLPHGLAIDALKNIYVANPGIPYITKAGPGGGATIGSGFVAALGVAVDVAGNVYVADAANSQITEIPVAGGAPVLLGSGLGHPNSVAVDANGNLYVTDNANNLVKMIPAGNGTPVAIGTGFNAPAGVAVDAAGNVFVADNGNNAVKEIVKADGSTVTIATRLAAVGITVDGAGNIYVADGGNHLLKLTPVGGYFITPFLPAGLSFDDNTGTISGTPTALSPAANYTVTAYNNGGSGTAIVNIKTVSGNAGLVSMGPQYGPLSPVFSTGITNYTLNVSNTVKTMWVKPVAADPNATITVNGSTVASGTLSTPVTLTEGTATTITVLVTAQGAGATKTYTINVTRGPSGNANLAGIGSSITPLTPIFSSANTNYTLSVGNATKTMTVSPVAADPNSTITVNGNPVTSGGLSQAVALTEGTTTAINVVVKAQNGATKTYTIMVTRALPGNANLASIGTSTPPLTPFFVPQTTSYTVSVTNATKTMTLTPVAADPLATITVNTATVASGATSEPVTLTAAATTTVTVVVTAQDGTTKTYKIAVTRAGSANNLLASMGPSISPMTPVFSPVKNSYTLSVPNTTQTMTVTPVTEDANAAITVNTATVASKSTSDPVALTAGATTPINVTVTAQNGATNTYMIEVTRAAGADNSFNPGISVTKPTETVTLAEDGIIVHQGISPNGDGVNDFLQIDNISQYPDNNLKIMNRNGQLVYEAKGYDNSSRTFDGHSNKNGQMQLPGTYFYQLDYTVNGIAKHKTGFIVLKY